MRLMEIMGSLRVSLTRAYLLLNILAGAGGRVLAASSIWALSFASGNGRGELLEIAHEAGILAAEKVGKAGAEIGLATPLEHVIFPGIPAPGLLGCHFVLVQQQVRSLEQRDQHRENDQLAF